jgi:hypothetical protein
MSDQTLADIVGSTDAIVDLLRSRGSGWAGFPNVPDEHTHWIEEQRAWAETCSFADQSHHMVDYWVEGPDALDLFSDLGVNGFDGFEPGTAKQLVVANPDGYFIGDGILLYLDREKLALVGPPQTPNWVQYHVETGDYDVRTERDETSGVRDGPPTNYRYQLQGPNAVDLMEEVTDEPLPDIGFFHFDDVRIDGREVTLLRHGMSGEAGFEFWGPWEDAEAVRSTILDAGDDSPSAFDPVSLDPFDECVQLGRLVDAVPQQIDGVALLGIDSKLDAADQSNALVLADRGRQAGMGSVVVGYRDDSHAGPDGGPGYGRQRHGSVRGGRVDVQVGVRRVLRYGEQRKGDSIICLE